MTTTEELISRIKEYLKVEPITSITVTLSHQFGQGKYVVDAREFIEYIEGRKK